MAVTAVDPPLPKSVALSKIVESVMRYALLIADSGSTQKLGYIKATKNMTRIMEFKQRTKTHATDAQKSANSQHL